jgi:DNA-directed RNA polymerase specialized sigma24 family protein
VTRHSGEALQALLDADPAGGWRVFIDEYTPVLLALIERAGLRDRDEAMDVYVRVCERLSEHGCARLRRRDVSRGALESWLAVLVRNVVVDWVRSRAGRRRLFGAVRRLDPFDQRVFELYYWQDRTPSEIAGVLGDAGAAGLIRVLDALERIGSVLSERHRSELISMTLRARSMASLESSMEEGMDVRDDRPDPELAVRGRETAALLASALAHLPSEDAAILRLKYVQGLTHRQIERALRLGRLTDERVAALTRTLRARLAEPVARGPLGPFGPRGIVENGV